MTTTDAPKPSTIKRLFALSGNQCAFPKCNTKLVEGDKVTGRICHIKARSKGGPRYDPIQSDDEKRGYENLLLMCPIHHDVIDNDPVSYTVERLTEIKKNHEKNQHPLNEEEVNMTIVKQFVQNLYAETKIEIHKEFQNNGQLAKFIVNYFVPDIPSKTVKVSSRRLLSNFQNNIEELKNRRETPRGVNIAKLSVPMEWEKLVEEITDYLNTSDSTTLFTFYEKIFLFNEFLTEADKYFRKSKTPIGLPLMDYEAGRLASVYEAHLDAILGLNLSSLLERLTTLAE